MNTLRSIWKWIWTPVAIETRTPLEVVRERIRQHNEAGIKSLWKYQAHNKL